MGRIIAIVGASGIGKTTLARALAETGNFALALETHETRPFQRLLAQDPRYAFHNQIDYLLFRAEQERALREEARPGILDGGLDMDFHGFTRLFYERGMLSEEEFALCKRLYETIRASQPPPDIFLRLNAPAEIIRRRLARRDRINIARAEDAARLNVFLEEYLQTLPPEKILSIDVSEENPTYRKTLEKLLPALLQRVA